MPQNNNNTVRSFNYTSVSRHNKRQVYQGFFSVEEYDLSYKKFDGSHSEVVTRGALISSDAVIVLPYDPVSDRVLLVEQFRTCLLYTSPSPRDKRQSRMPSSA